MTIALDTLKALPIFSDLNQEEGNILIHNSRIRRCEKGQFLFMHGDKITHFYVLCRGSMQIFHETPDGHEVTSDILIAGDCINADEIIAKQNYHTVNARAVYDTALLEIPITWMRDHIKDFDHIAQRLMTSLTDRLHKTQIEAEHLSTMSAAQIVACYLQKLCVLYNFNPHGFELPYSKTLIASRLRMELETFSRALQKLKDQGIVVTGTHVSFTNMQKTSHFVCDECSLSEDCSTHKYLHDKLAETTKFGT